MRKIEVNKIIKCLEEMYPNAKAELQFNSVFELLVAVILSAQCTDRRVNVVTEQLFQEYNTPEAFAKLTVEELMPKIWSCGLGKQKAKGIIGSSQIIVRDFNGQVPSSKDDLQKLPSVGRKTANVVASVGYGIPSIAVDTHVFRVSNRIGLANAKNVLQTENQLMKILPKEKWTRCHHLLIFHGRRCCYARNPDCENCIVNKYCKKYNGDVL